MPSDWALVSVQMREARLVNARGRGCPRKLTAVGFWWAAVAHGLGERADISTAPSFSPCRSASPLPSFHLLPKLLTLLHGSTDVGFTGPVIARDLAL